MCLWVSEIELDAGNGDWKRRTKMILIEKNICFGYVYEP